MSRRRAFSLVELLVVVAIIVALLALLLPSMARAIEASHRAICASNQHQTHTALSAWAGDRYGQFVEGQPAYDRFRDMNDNSVLGNMGQYCVWNRQWTNPSQKEEYGGKYAKHGALVARGYLRFGRTFFCPSWTVPWIQYQTSGKNWGNNGGGWFENLQDVPGVQDWMQTSYHYNSQFGSGDYSDIVRARSARLMLDPGSAAIMADAFSDPTRGVDFHHRDGYSVLYLGGHTAYYDDPTSIIRDLKGGNTYHSGKESYQLYQSRVWMMFEGRQ